MEVRDAVVSVGHAFHCRLIDAVLDHYRRERSSGDQRLTHNDVTPSRRHSIRTDADLDPVRMHRTIIAAAHVILTCPDELDRRATQTLRNYGRFALHV